MSGTDTTAVESVKYVVIGAGLSGASAAWRLAQSGAEVVVVERDVPASAQGSSHGSARIFRYAYHDQFYTDLVVEAKRGWDELEASSGKRLITPSGALDFGSIRDPKSLAAVLDHADVEHELLAQEEAAQRWPQLNFDTEVLWHPGAGVIDAESSVHAMLDLAISAGAEVRSGWDVETVATAPTGYLVTSASGARIHAEQVIVSAGGWLPALLGSLDLPQAFVDLLPQFQVRQEYAYHFPYRNTDDQGETGPQEAASWPTFIYKGDDIQTYSLPGGRDADFRGQKIAEYNGGKKIPSARDQDGRMDAANRDRVVSFVERFLPGVLPDSYAETTCLFTNVPGDDMIIDRVDGITILSPCSGQGAKFAPLLGEAVLDLVAGSGIAQERFRATGQRFVGE